MLQKTKNNEKTLFFLKKIKKLIRNYYFFKNLSNKLYLSGFIIAFKK